MKLTKRQQRVLDALRKSTDPKGEHAYGLSKKLGWRDTAGHVSGTFMFLHNNGLIERRKQGQPWANERVAPDGPPSNPERPRVFYRVAPSVNTGR